jgi:7,8-dihydropterin-6-yl-methyl-4-(beta-D-ribofuranosyl)aminobenzene 5'-phosphate synthase
MPSSNNIEALKITVLYDNNAYDQRLKTAWGFSALLEYDGSTVLFDTGGEGPTLMANIAALGVDPSRIDTIFLSHAHNDHIGGLSGFLTHADRPTIYLLPSFPGRLKQSLSEQVEIVEVTPGLSPIPGITSTGEMGSDIPEQSLMIHTSQGIVVITGCAHPGIVKIIEQAKELTGEPIFLAMGGFHLKDTNKTEIESIIADFQRLGVEKVAPTHCTGDQAIAQFQKAYGDNFIPTGVGTVIQIED